MSDDMELAGGEAFYRLSKALKAAGDGDLRKELNKGLRAAGKPLIKDTRAEALRILPKRGGLAKLVAKEPQRVQVRTGATTAGVRIVVGKKRGAARAANRGLIRHPVFASHDLARKEWAWVAQRVKPGWFDATLAGKGPDVVKPELQAAIQSVVNQVVARAAAEASGRTRGGRRG